MNLNRVDLNLLVALDALLTERNVTRAAERMSIGQPAMSAALARLRRLFDDPLLVRNGRILEPTALSQQLAPALRAVLIDVEDLLRRRPEFDPSTDRRDFTVVASDYVVLILVRRLLESLAAEAPNVRVIVNPLTAGFRREIERGDVDLLLLPIEIDPGLGRLPHRELFSDRYVCAVWDQHPEVGEDMTLELLSRLPYLAYAPPTLASFVEVQLDALGVERNVEVSTQSLVLTPFLLRGTRLVAMLHERLARDVERRAQLRILESPVALKPITEVMFWHRRFDDDPSHTWLRERILALAANI